MNTIQRPPVSAGEREQLPDDFDRLLRAFFDAERPAPWPVLKPPAERPSPLARPTTRRRTLLGSRVALAASLLILLAGPFYLSSRFAELTPAAVDADSGTTTAQARGPLMAPAKMRPAPRPGSSGVDRSITGKGKPAPSRRQ
jgi:hypothetical protein